MSFRVEIAGPGNRITCHYRGRGVADGTLRLPADRSTIEAGAAKADRATSASLFALELIDVMAKADLARRVEALKPDATWMSDRTYGLMFRRGGWGCPEHGEPMP